MMNKKMRRFAAAALSACVVASAGTAVGTMTLFANEETAAEDEGRVSLSIADGAEDDTADAEDAEVTEQTETETPVVYETLETTNTSDAVITAIDVSEVVENTMPSIVSITTKSIQEVQSYFYGVQQYEAQGGGSGIIIAQNDDELLIATNNHVVDGSTEITVCFTVDAENVDDLIVPGTVKGTNSKNDLAVVAVKLADIPEKVFEQLKIATMGNSNNLKVGETAIVIGNALADGQTVTSGIISALEREITTEAGTFTELQTDAAINFGCSGGAILNAKGEVIAITDAKATANNAESMGYGIPISTAIPILQDLINRETRDAVENHGYLGVTVVPVSDEAKQMYNMPAGAFVYEISEDSAAAKAGIKKGDIITKFDGIEIGSSDELVDTIKYYEVGETVKVELQVSDNGSYTTKEVEVTMQGSAEPEDAEEIDEDAPEADGNADELVPEYDDIDGDGEIDEDYDSDREEYENWKKNRDNYYNSPFNFFPFGGGFGF